MADGEWKPIETMPLRDVVELMDDKGRTTEGFKDERELYAPLSFLAGGARPPFVKWRAMRKLMGE